MVCLSLNVLVLLMEAQNWLPRDAALTYDETPKPCDP